MTVNINGPWDDSTIKFLQSDVGYSSCNMMKFHKNTFKHSHETCTYLMGRYYIKTGRCIRFFADTILHYMYAQGNIREVRWRYCYGISTFHYKFQWIRNYFQREIWRSMLVWKSRYALIMISVRSSSMNAKVHWYLWEYHKCW